MKRCLFCLLLTMSMSALANENLVWGDFQETKNNTGLVSKRLVKNLLKQGIGQVKIHEFTSWSAGKNSKGRAEGMGKLILRGIIGEAGGYRKFQKEICLEGKMENGLFISEVIMTVYPRKTDQNTDYFDYETKVTAFTDGILVFERKVDFEYANSLYLVYLEEISKLAKQLEALPTEEERQKELAKILADFHEQEQDKKAQEIIKGFEDDSILKDLTVSTAGSFIANHILDATKFLVQGGTMIIKKTPLGKVVALFMHFLKKSIV